MRWSTKQGRNEVILNLQPFADMLRLKRGSRGVRAAADDAGVSSATFSRAENGGTPDVETFGKLCRWLGADPGPLLGLKPCDAPASPESFSLPTAAEIGQMILAAQRSGEELQRVVLRLAR